MPGLPDRGFGSPVTGTVPLARQVIESSDASAHARAVATGMLGSILGLRGQARQARPLLLESATLARHIELAAMELTSGWGLAIVDNVEEAPSRLPVTAGPCWNGGSRPRSGTL